MSYRRRNKDVGVVVVRRDALPRASVLAIALVALGIGVARADEEILQFDKVAPEDIARPPQHVRSRRDAIDEPLNAVAPRGGDAQQVIDAILEGVPPLRRPVVDEPVLVFQRAGEGGVSMDPPAAAPGREAVDTVASTAQSPALDLTYRPTVLGRVLPGDIVLPEQAMEHSERELRDIFQRVVGAALQMSPAVGRAMAEQSASLADVAEAKGQRYPQLEIGARSPFVNFGVPGKNTSTEQNLSIDMSMPVFDWGRLSKTIKSRNHMASAAEAALQAEMENLAYEATFNLIELGKQRLIVDISQRYVDRMSELVKMLEGIVAVDPGRVSELTQARSRLLNAEASRTSAVAKARDTEIALRKMVGDRPIPSLPAGKAWSIHLPDLQWLLAESQNHPSILQAQAQARSADLQADAVRSAALPQVNWIVGKTTAEGADGREPAWHTGLTLSWAAFRGGSNRASQRAARQRAEAGWHSAEQQVRDIEYRIRAANHDAGVLSARADLYRGLIVETNRVREAFYEQWYHLGRRTLLDVLSSESEHYNNQVAEVATRFDGYQAVIAQYATSGVLVRWLGNSVSGRMERPRP